MAICYFYLHHLNPISVRIDMPVFKKNFKYIDISYYYDTLTTYFNFNIHNSKEYELFDKFYSNLQWSHNYKYYIHQSHREHDLHHKGIKSKKEHAHLKFQAMLQPEQISEVLDGLVKYHLMTSHEKSNFMRVLIARYDRLI